MSSTDWTGTSSTGCTGTSSTGWTTTSSTGWTGTSITGWTGTSITGWTGTSSTGWTTTSSTGWTGTSSRTGAVRLYEGCVSVTAEFCRAGWAALVSAVGLAPPPSGKCDWVDSPQLALPPSAAVNTTNQPARGSERVTRSNYTEQTPR